MYNAADHFTLDEHPRNLGTVKAGYRHEQKSSHMVMALYDDLPGGDFYVGRCCYSCDWQREFPFKDKRLRKKFQKQSNSGMEVRKCQK